MSYNGSLNHYGVLGMRWGIHKNNRDKSFKKAGTANIESWGKDSSHNILYITGYSGSGKSTIARELSDKNTNTIHLDPFFEKMDKNVSANIMDKEFITFLEKKFPDYKSIATAVRPERHSKEWWKKVDNLMKNTEDFASKQYYKKKKVIVEGVQLHDETTYPDKNFFKDKPIVITGTTAVTSFLRASKRDGRSILTSLKSTKEYIRWYCDTYKSLNKLSKTVNTKKGSEWVKKYLSLKVTDI